MPEKTQLFIADPCHEQWGDMQPAENGRFCGACQKTVVDFTMMSDQEVLSWLSGTGKSVCGRFMGDQLNRELSPVKPGKKSRWAVWQFLLAGLLITSEVSAQKGTSGGPQIEHIDPGPARGLIPAVNGVGDTNRIILGGFRSRSVPEHPDMLRVLIIDSESNGPIPWASIRMGKGEEQRMANSQGWFDISHKEARRVRYIEVSAVGYTTALAGLGNVGKDEDVLVVRLNRAVVELPPATVVNYGTTTKGKLTITCTQTYAMERVIKDTLAFIGIIKKPFIVYPNLVARGAAVTLSLQKTEPGDYLVQLFSNAGALVETMRVEGVEGPRTELLNIPGTVAAGLYFIRLLHVGTGKVYTQKVVVM